MSKLLKFKKFVTIPEAARHLSGVFEEEVTEKDVAELIDAGHIEASIIARSWAGYNTNLSFEGKGVSWGFRLSGRPDEVLNGIYRISPRDANYAGTDEQDAVLVRGHDGLWFCCFEIKGDSLSSDDAQDNLVPSPSDDDLPDSVSAISDLCALVNFGMKLPIPEKAHARPSTQIENLVIEPSELFAFIAKALSSEAQPDKPADMAEAEARPSHLRAIAALLELLKAPVEFPRQQGMNQEAIKDAILAQFPWRGLGDRNLQKIFAAANKAKTDAALDTK